MNDEQPAQHQPAPARQGDDQRAPIETRSDAPYSPRWQRGDRTTAAAEWEVSDYYGSFDDPRP